MCSEKTPPLKTTLQQTLDAHLLSDAELMQQTEFTNHLFQELRYQSGAQNGRPVFGVVSVEQFCFWRGDGGDGGFDPTRPRTNDQRLVGCRPSDAQLVLKVASGCAPLLWGNRRSTSAPRERGETYCCRFHGIHPFGGTHAFGTSHLGGTRAHLCAPGAAYRWWCAALAATHGRPIGAVSCRASARPPGAAAHAGRTSAEASRVARREGCPLEKARAPTAPADVSAPGYCRDCTSPKDPRSGAHRYGARTGMHPFGRPRPRCDRSSIGRALGQPLEGKKGQDCWTCARNHRRARHPYL
jgi:hypothetical protein